MPDILIKQVPADLHLKLREEAKKHRRSMNQEVLTILEKELGPAMATDVRAWPPPFEGKRIVTRSMVSKAIREGRP